jgi:hypothetical protein
VVRAHDHIGAALPLRREVEGAGAIFPLPILVEELPLPEITLGVRCFVEQFLDLGKESLPEALPMAFEKIDDDSRALEDYVEEPDEEMVVPGSPEFPVPIRVVFPGIRVRGVPSVDPAVRLRRSIEPLHPPGAPSVLLFHPLRFFWLP